MKMMNQIESEVAGRVVSVLVDNGDAGRVRAAAVSHRTLSSSVRSSTRCYCESRRDRAARSCAPAASSASRLSRCTPTADANLKHVLLADETVCIGPAAVVGQLSEHAGDHRGRRGHRRRRHSSRLRVPVRERRFCRARRGERLHLHWTAPGHDPPHGRQGLGHSHDAGSRRALRAGLGRAAAARRQTNARGSRARSATRSSSRPQAAAAVAVCASCTAKRRFSTPLP